MAGFVHFLGFFGHKIHITGYIELKQAMNMYIDTKLGLIENINIWLIYGPKSLYLKIPMIPYKDIRFLAITQLFFV